MVLKSLSNINDTIGDGLKKLGEIRDFLLLIPITIEILKQMIKIGDSRPSYSIKDVKIKAINLNYDQNLFHLQVFLLIFNTEK